MKRISLGNRLTPYLLLTCVVLAGVVALEWHLGAGADIQGPTRAPPATTKAPPPARTGFVAPGIETFSEILERPLFTAGREPPEEPAVAATTAVVPTTQVRLRLEGVAITPATRVAVVRDLASNQLLRLAEGAQHQGWVVETVHAAGATLKQGQQTQELVLEVSKNPQLQSRSATRSSVLSGARSGHIGVRRKTAPSTGNQQAESGAATGDASEQTSEQAEPESDAAPAGQKDDAGHDEDATSVLPSHPLAPFPLAPQAAQAADKKSPVATP